MARLVLINGAPGSGKSTLARMYAEAHPLTLALDIDVVRAMLGRWLDHPTDAGLIARAMAVEMARVQLMAGRDVVVPQFLGRVEFIVELEKLCQQVGADFVELALLSNPQDLTRRFVHRSRHPETPAHRDAAVLMERSGGVQELPAMNSRMLEVVASRPGTRTVMTVSGEPDRAYRDLLALINQR
ncbi:MAG: ATP-binding protein [Actinomycetota bacterium]|nr:ATP-binding protein [Actinomycetota bacterium]